MGEITLYFHIGATKTGTTALQRFLEKNFSRLINEFGVFYPNFHDTNIFTSMRAGYNYWQGHYFENTDGSEDIKVFANCIKYCKQNSLTSIVILHEALLVNWHERLGRLAGKLDANIKIICYVRRQDHHLESAWKQWGHRFVSSTQIMESVNTHAEQWGGWRSTDWGKLLEPWSNNFGKENIIVRPYEKQQMPDGVLTDFLQTIQISWPEKPEVGTDVSINSGFSRDVLEFLYLNRDLYEDIPNQSLHNMMNAVLGSSYQKKPFVSYGILSPRERLEILKKYEFSNQSVARNYLKRDDGILFYEPWPDPDDVWEPYKGLTVENLVPIITKVMYKLYSQQTRHNMNPDLLVDETLWSFLKRMYHNQKRIKKDNPFHQETFFSFVKRKFCELVTDKLKFNKKGRRL